MKFIATTCGNPSWSTVASAAFRFSRRNAVCSSGVRRISRRGIALLQIGSRSQQDLPLASRSAAAEFDAELLEALLQAAVELALDRPAAGIGTGDQPGMRHASGLH